MFFTKDRVFNNYINIFPSDNKFLTTIKTEMFAKNNVQHNETNIIPLPFVNQLGQ